MDRTKLKTATLLVSLLSAISALGGQSYYEYKFVFQGTAYQTNGAGNIVATPITEKDLIADRAQQYGVTNLSSLAIVYHINGDTGQDRGDTVEVIYTNGTQLSYEFGFYFAEAAQYCRIALTNAPQTEMIRHDYLYTLGASSTYTYNCSDSVGGALVTKRFLTDTNGNVHATIEGPMSWIVLPQSGRGTIICNGNFTLGAPMF